MSEQTNPVRDEYRYFMTMPTRWHDVDIYGHVNNVIYYYYFDTIVGHFLINEGGLIPSQSDVIGYIVESHCKYLKGMKFPQELELAMRVNKLGNSSVEYGLAVFIKGDEHPSAYGGFTHVFVARDNERPTPIPGKIRAALESVHF